MPAVPLDSSGATYSRIEGLPLQIHRCELRPLELLGPGRFQLA